MMKRKTIFPTFAGIAAIASALLIPAASSAASVNTFTDNGVNWKLSADYVAGSQYIANPPANWSVRFDDTQTGAPRFYCNMTLTGFSYTESNSSREIQIPATIRWDSGGSYGVGAGPLQFISSGAFTGKDITSVDVPSTILGINLPCFRNCTRLASITVDDFNKYYSAKDGVLYDYDKTKLLKYPEGKAGSYFEVPKTVTALQSGCLAGTKLEGVRFRGNKPTCATNAFTGSSFTGYCPESWGMYKGEIWNGIPMYPIPDQCELIDGILWYYRVVAGKAKVESVTVVASDWSGKLSMPSKLAGKSVTDIGPNAFSSCRGLESISIPKSVTNISACAFSGCPGQIFDTGTIPGVTLVDGWVVGCANALSGTLELTGARGIAEQAFAGCPGLTSVTIPDSVANIGANAFSGCDGLIALYVPDGWSKMGLLTQAGLAPDCVVLYQRGAPVNESLWEYCISDGKATITRSEVLVIPSELGGCPVTCIGDSAFEGCTGMSSVSIPDGVTSIGDSAFGHCHSLAIMTIPDSVTSVGDNAFLDCSALATLSVPGSWDGTGMLAKAKVPEGCTVVYRKDWQYSISNGEATVTGVTPAVGDVEIPRELDGYPVTSIGAHAFAHAGVTSVTIPDSVTNIGEEAFSGCGELRTVTIPDSVRKIGANAFDGCRELATLYVPLSWKETDMLAETGVQEDCKMVYLNLDPTWQYTISKGTATVTSVTPAEGNVVIPSTLGGYPVTSIGEFAFSHCVDLTGVMIPDSVSNIGAYAFSGCRSLTSVVFSDNVTSIGDRAFEGCSGLYDTNTISGVCLVRGWAVGWTNPLSGHLDLTGVRGIAGHAFYECGGLTSVTIPDSVTSIGDYAFDGCRSLTSVAIPDSVTIIGDFAFSYCRGLTNVTIGNSVTNIGMDAFRGCSGMEVFSVAAGNPAYKSESGLLLTKDGKTLVSGVNGDVSIPDSVSIIGDYAFCECSGLTGVIIPDSVCSIGDYAFRDCSGLTGVTIPDSVTSIGDLAFHGCNALYDTTTLPGVCLVDGWAIDWADPLPGILDLAGVRGIAYGALKYCTNLTSVLIPDSVTSIGADAFGYCSGLTSVTILGNVTNDWYLYSSPFYNCTNLATLVLGGKMTTIGEYMFSGCIGLTNLMIGNSVKSINGNAFRDCSGLTSVMIPDSVENIGWAAFSGCIGLTNVTIPDSVTSIDGAAFYGCSGLTNLTIGNGVKSIETSAFCDCSGLSSVLIPDRVENIGWAAFSGCIGLTNLTIGKSVKSIDGYAFYGCSALTSVTIPDSVTSIGVDAFRDCGTLNMLYVPASWEGTDMLVDAGLPPGCEVVYRDAPPAGEVTWRYNVDNGVATVTGVEPAEGNLAIPAVLGGYPVTSIGNTAFEGCAGLRSVVIPDTVTNIEYDAFAACSGLTSINIPETVTSLGYHAFRECTGLTSVRIPASVESIGGGVFSYCDAMREITVDAGNAQYKSEAGVLFSKDGTSLLCCPGGRTGNYTIPDGVVDIGMEAFRGCNGLASVLIPDSVETIGWQAFGECADELYDTDSIPGVRLVDGWAVDFTPALSGPLDLSGVRGIGDSAFSHCNGLASVIIPDGVSRIGDGAFWGCSALATVSIPSSVTSIGTSAFDGCTGLTSVIIQDLAAWCAIPFGYDDNPLYYAQHLYMDGVEIRDLVIPDTVASIGERAFIHCAGLASVTIPDSVTNIGAGAFSGCSGLTSVVIPDSVEAIEWYAFAQCGNLRSLELPQILCSRNGLYWAGLTNVTEAVIRAGVTNIESYAFLYCNSLVSVTIPDSVENIENYAFRDCSSQLFDTSTIPGVSLVDGWAVGHEDSLSGALDLTGVRGIAEEAFYFCPDLTSVTIPDGVRTIGRWAFGSCGGLTSVTIPDSVAYIGAGAFGDCSGLREFTVAADNANYSSVDGVLFSKDGTTLICCPGGKTGGFRIPDGVGSIEEGAFSWCSGLAALNIPESVASIGINAFANSGLRTLFVPAAWEGSGMLSDAAVPDGCAVVYCRKGSSGSDAVWHFGILNGEATILGVESADGALVIPPELDGCPVTSIGPQAFYACSGLTSITIPDNVSSIGHDAVAGCSGLKELSIPANWQGTSMLADAGVPEGCEVVYRALPVRWHYSVADGVATITGAEPAVGHLEIPSEVDGLPVARIGDYAFFDCSGLASVAIPDSVVDIGVGAFQNCSGLTSVTLPESVTSIESCVFGYCSGLTSISIPVGVTSIGDSAFLYCSGLTSLSIPAGVTNIGSSAFSGCNSLNRLMVADGNAHFSSRDGILYSKSGDILLCCPPGAKSGVFAIPAGVARIESYAFSGCTGLASVSIPDSVTSIGRMAFLGCDGVMDTESIPGLALVDGWVVQLDYDTAYATLVDALDLAGCRGIADWAVNGCGVTSVSIPASVACIGVGPFAYCDGLTRIDVAEDNPAYTSVDGVLFTKDMKTLLSCPGGKRGTYEIPVGVERLADEAFVGCFWLEMEALPSNVTCIGAGAFDSCDSVVRMVIQNSVTNMGAGAFGYCDALESVLISGSVKQIERDMFRGCTNLQELVIGDGVTSIGDSAFAWCSALPSLIIPGSVTSVGKDVFDRCDALKTLYVPAAWAGTDILADAAVPAGCTVVYRDGSEEPTTQDTPVPVAHGWLEENAADILAASGGDYEAAAKALAANGQPVWQCYVAGLSTTDEQAKFKVKSISFESGEPMVEWDPDLAEDRAYTVQGKAAMADDWGVTNASSRFFRVLVEMPE